MKRRNNRPPEKAHRDGFAAGYAKGRDERQSEVRQLKDAPDKALAENLAMRGKPNHLGA